MHNSCVIVFWSTLVHSLWLFFILTMTYIWSIYITLVRNTECNSIVFLTWYQSHPLVAMVFCPCSIFNSNLCLPWCFFAAFIFFDFLLLPLKLSGTVKPPLEFVSTLQDHCLRQATVTELNFIQRIFSTLSNLKISSSFHLEFERGC